MLTYTRPAPGTEMPTLSWQDLRDRVNPQTVDVDAKTKKDIGHRTTDVASRTRRCNTCHAWKSFEEYGANRRESTGIARTCRPCHNAKQLQRYRHERALIKAAKAAGITVDVAAD